MKATTIGTIPLGIALLGLLGTVPAAAQQEMPAPAAKSAATPAAVEEPRDLVAALYRLAASQAKRKDPTSPFFDPDARAKYFSKAFDLAVTARETKAAHDKDAWLDFDPISASQDAELQKVTLKTDLLEARKAVVSASFLNRGQPTIVTYDFVKEPVGWRIDDIKGTTEKEAWSVRKILRADGKAPTALPGMTDAKLPPDAPLPPKRAGEKTTEKPADRTIEKELEKAPETR